MRLAGRCPRRLIVPALVAGAFLALAGGPLPTSGPAAAQPAAPATKVSMKDFTFMPAAVTIKAGTAVTWTYDEVATDPMGCEAPQFQIPGAPVSCPGHSTTAVDAGPQNGHLWDSGVHRASGFPFSYTFTKPGKYHYICTVHGGAAKNNPITNMEGDIVVEAAAGAAVQSPAPASSRTGSASGSASAPRTGASVATGELSRTGGRALLGWGLLPLLLALVVRQSRRPS